MQCCFIECMHAVARGRTNRSPTAGLPLLSNNFPSNWNALRGEPSAVALYVQHGSRTCWKIPSLYLGFRIPDGSFAVTICIFWLNITTLLQRWQKVAVTTLAGLFLLVFQQVKIYSAHPWALLFFFRDNVDDVRDRWKNFFNCSYGNRLFFFEWLLAPEEFSISENVLW